MSFERLRRLVTKEMPTTVLYWIPGDGDEEGEPNFFTLPVDPKSVTVRDIMEGFPLGSPSDFHIRFKFKFTGTYIWRDPPQNTGVTPPRYNGDIMLKVTRLDAEAGAAPEEEGAGSVDAARARAAARPRLTTSGGGGGSRSSTSRRNSRDDLSIDYRRPSLESPLSSPRSRRQSIKNPNAGGNGMAQDDLLNMGSFDEQPAQPPAGSGGGADFDLLGLR